MTETVEKLVLIAERIPPGDNWLMKGTKYPSLIETLNAYHIMNVGKHKAYRLEPTQGKIYAIVETIQEVEPSKKYNIYNDYN
jgi:hypothetical protein